MITSAAYFNVDIKDDHQLFYQNNKEYKIPFYTPKSQDDVIQDIVNHIFMANQPSGGRPDIKFNLAVTKNSDGRYAVALIPEKNDI